MKPDICIANFIHYTFSLLTFHERWFGFVIAYYNGRNLFFSHPIQQSFRKGIINSNFTIFVKDFFPLYSNDEINIHIRKWIETDSFKTIQK